MSKGCHACYKRGWSNRTIALHETFTSQRFCGDDNSLLIPRKIASRYLLRPDWQIPQRHQTVRRRIVIEWRTNSMTQPPNLERVSVFLLPRDLRKTLHCIGKVKREGKFSFYEKLNRLRERKIFVREVKIARFPRARICISDTADFDEHRWDARRWTGCIVSGRQQHAAVKKRCMPRLLGGHVCPP